MAGTTGAPAVAEGQFSGLQFNTFTAGDTPELQLFVLPGPSSFRPEQGLDLMSYTWHNAITSGPRIGGCRNKAAGLSAAITHPCLIFPDLHHSL